MSHDLRSKSDQPSVDEPSISTSSDFPEVEITVASITERSRATLAKTHVRPMVANFTDLVD